MMYNHIMLNEVKNYQSKLNLIETEIAIKFIKDNFEKDLAKKLGLVRVSAPLFVEHSSGLNDGLNGTEEPVSFKSPFNDENIEIVHSLAKWKRMALKKYEITTHKGIYTDMNAIRKDEETLDNIHSIYVDQWDWEIVIDKNDRNLKTLYNVVRKIYSVLKQLERKVNNKYQVFSNKLPKNIHFITSSKLLSLYPDKTSKEREYLITKEYGAVFISKIGYKLKDKRPHDLRAADYDDWNLNGDILVYDSILDTALELSSMGIRVSEKSIIKQLKEKNEEYKLNDSPFVKDIVNQNLPYTMGGGIGQSRLCMFFLEKAHIGEVQSSIWSDEDKEKLSKLNIKLL